MRIDVDRLLTRKALRVSRFRDVMAEYGFVADGIDVDVDMTDPVAVGCYFVLDRHAEEQLLPSARTG